MKIEIYKDDVFQYSITSYSGRIEVKQSEVFLQDINVRIILDPGVKIIII